MGRKVTIISDFIDYYDHAFDSILFPHDIVWKRSSYNGIKRRDILRSLDAVGLITPLHGEVDKIVPLLKSEDPSKEVVVYTDEYAHCGNGKIKLTVSAAMEWSGCYCSEYIRQPGPNAISFRVLRVGVKCWLLRYIGKNSWMSNSAEDVSIEVLSKLNDLDSIMKNTPMLAIDYVLDWHNPNMHYFIDVNTAPGLKWTGMEDILKPNDVYELILDYYDKANSENDWDKSL